MLDRVPEPAVPSGQLFAGGPGIISPSPLPGDFGTTKLGRPYSAAIIVVKDSNRQLVTRVKPSANGLFTVSLPPGTYVLTPKVPKNGPFPMPTTVDVTPGDFVRVKVYVSGP